MKMSELEKLPLGTLVAAYGLDSRNGPEFVGTLHRVWNHKPDSQGATILGGNGKEWQALAEFIFVADEAHREAFERDKTRIAQQDAECERFANALGIARVDVRHSRNVILSWEEAAAIVARLEAGEK